MVPRYICYPISLLPPARLTDDIIRSEDWAERGKKNTSAVESSMCKYPHNPEIDWVQIDASDGAALIHLLPLVHK